MQRSLGATATVALATAAQAACGPTPPDRLPCKGPWARCVRHHTDSLFARKD